MNLENSTGIMLRGTLMDNCHVIKCGGESTFVSQGERGFLEVGTFLFWALSFCSIENPLTEVGFSRINRA